MQSKSSKRTGKPIGLVLLFLIIQALTGQKATAQPSFASQPEQFAQATGTAATLCPAQLEEAIEAITQRPEFQRSRWGILVQPLSSTETLYERDRDRYFIPASNIKLLTTAAALQTLGPQYRIRTSIYNTSTDSQTPSLRLVGRGDPTVTQTQLRDLAQQLKRQGYNQIQQLVLEDAHFQGTEIHPSWEWEDVHYYFAVPVNSLILNQNAVGLTLSPSISGRPLQPSWSDRIAGSQWQLQNNSITGEPGSATTVDLTAVLGSPVLRVIGQLPAGAQPNVRSLAVPNPAQYFSQHFRLALGAEQINVGQTQVVFNRENQNYQEVAAIESPALATLLADTNQPSNNLFAETLLRSLGATQTTNGDTAATGIAVLQQTLTQLGVSAEGYRLVDGSGLSRHNLLTPDATVQLLQAMAQSPHAATFRASLPVAGASGTLRNRLQNLPAQAIVQAKTGTMTGVVTLSGYITQPNYQPLAFSIFVNQSNQPAATTRRAVDDVVLTLSRLRRC